MSREEYRSIAKGSSVFGGVQVFNIVINLIRGKFIAMFLGAAGMGVSALLTSTVAIVSQITQLGLNMSAVRDISQAHEKGDTAALGRKVHIFRRLVTATGLIGAIVTLAASSRLSRWAFGNSDYSFAFAILSVMVFFTTLSEAQTAVLQGTRRLKYLATSTIVGSAVGLVIGVPLYYFFGTKGIAPAMIIFAMSAFFTKQLFIRKMNFVRPHVSLREVTAQGKGMAALGMAMMISLFLGTLATYLTYIYIRYAGDMDDTGLFQAASSITNQYAGLVVSAMAMDYFPRLAAVADNDKEVSVRVNLQSEIMALVIVPLAIAMIIAAPLVIRILLTGEFIAIVPMLRWMGVGVFVKMVSFPIGYISFAKGDKRTFLLLEGVFSNLLMLGMNVVCYKFMGLSGLGVAMLATYIIYLGAVYIVAHRLYRLKLSYRYLRLLATLTLPIVAVFGLSYCGNAALFYTLGCGVFALSCFYSWRELDRRIGIKEIIRAKLLHRV